VDDQGVARARDGRTGKIIAESSDHASVLQTALDTAPDYAVVYVKYAKIKSTVTIKHPLTLTGERIDVDIAGTADAIRIGDGEKPVEHVVIEGLRIAAVNSGFNGYLVRGYGARLATMRNCYLSQPYGSSKAARFETAGLSNIWHVWVLDSRFWPGSLELYVSDSWIRGNTFNGISSPFAVYVKTGNVFIADNHIIPPTVDKGSGGLVLESCWFVRVIGNFFDGSYDDLDTNHGINANTVYWSSFVGNTFWNIGRSGIYARKLLNCVIAGNVFADNDKELNGWADVLLDSETNGFISAVLLSDNVFRKEKRNDPSLPYAIKVTGAGTKYFIDIDGMVVDKATAVAQAYSPPGFYFETGASMCRARRVRRMFLSENSGAATIPAGQTSATVSHGLAVAPSRVLVTPAGNLGGVWVENITSTSFTIRCSTAPSANTEVYWYAEI
jgi:hypothetical protein